MKGVPPGSARCRGRPASARSSRCAQLDEIRLLRAVDGAERTDGRRFVARHAGAEQAGDRDGGDDADDRHDDQQFDEREALVVRIRMVGSLS